MKSEAKEIMLGKLVDEYLLKLKAGQKLSINDWVKQHPEVPADELRQQLQMGVLLTKVGQTGRPRPTLTAEQRNRIKQNTLAYYDELTGGPKAAPRAADNKLAYDYLDKAADTFGKQDYPATRELLTKAITIHQKLDNKVWLGFEHMVLGLMEMAGDNLDRALDYYHKSLDYYLKANESKGAASMAVNIGIVYHYQSETAKGRPYYQQAITLSEKAGLSDILSHALLNLGDIEFKDGNYKACYQLTRRALDEATKAGDKSLMASAYHNLGELAVATGGHKHALEYYHQSLALSRELNDFRMIAQTAGVLGSLYANHLQWPEANQCFNEAASAVDKITGASQHPSAVAFRRTLGGFGLPSTDEILTDFRRRLDQARVQV
ncbi:MAG: tetratricopeptide repeat protein [Planctomycetes bacterium]|nr:tetratricopeptide repeat protein [Planctomycetota bacterium]